MEGIFMDISFNPFMQEETSPKIKPSHTQQVSAKEKPASPELEKKPVSIPIINNVIFSYNSSASKMKNISMKLLGARPGSNQEKLAAIEREKNEKSQGFLQTTETDMFKLSKTSQLLKDQTERPVIHQVDKATFNQAVKDIIQSSEEQRLQCEKKTQEIATQPPAQDVLNKVSLNNKYKRYDYLESLSTMDGKKLELFQNQRMLLSKTMARYPREKKQWLQANEEIIKLTQEKNKITIENMEKIQIILNQIVLYLDTWNSDKKGELNNYILWLNTQLDLCKKGKKNPIVASAQAYQYFLKIHPFQDGNGRIGRFMMDLVLQRSGLPPANLSGSMIDGNVDRLVYEVENDIDKLVSAIHKGIETFCQQNNHPSPFKT
jgi:prophage maintenance system killer protein